MVELHYGELANSVRAVAVQRRMPRFGLDERFPQTGGPKEIAPVEVEGLQPSSLPVTTTSVVWPDHPENLLFSYQSH